MDGSLPGGFGGWEEMEKVAGSVHPPGEVELGVGNRQECRAQSFHSRLSEDSSKEGSMEMCPMGESLLQAGRDMVLAAFQLQEHPDSPRHREHLAVAAKRTLMETAKVRGTLGRDMSWGGSSSRSMEQTTPPPRSRDEKGMGIPDLSGYSALFPG